MNIKKQIMIRFGELNTKGKNKKDFIKILSKNIKNSINNYFPIEQFRIFSTHDHIYIDVSDEINIEELLEILKKIPGIYSFSLIYKMDSKLEDISLFIKEYILKNKNQYKTFKIEAKRSDKRFPIHSIDIIKYVASDILKTNLFKVDVHNPDLHIHIEIHNDGAVIYFNSIKGLGGFPLSSIGKGLMLISGGIDSPVASYLLMKRGLKLEFIHFASPPYTQEGVLDKIRDLLNKLNVYQDKIILHIIPFTKIQEEIYKNSDISYTITILRRMMFKIAFILSEKFYCNCICTGESLGQVASQTLDSMNVICNNINKTIIRPLSVFDKSEIIKIAKEINTYDISIRPYEDCCTIFKPKNPKTSPKLESCLQYESKVDYDLLIKDAIENIKTEVIENKKFQI